MADIKDKFEKVDVEVRTFVGGELRTATADERPVIEGYASVFDKYSEDLGGFVEIIEPGFFDEVLENDVRSLINHDPHYILGRTTNKTLELKQDSTGLFQRTYPPVTDPESTQYAKDLMVSIRRGDITQQSFAFIVKRTYRGDAVDGDEWIVAGDMVIRKLKKGGCRELLDVSPVTYPAYVQTNVSADTRSRFEEFKQSLQAGQAPAPEGEADGRQVPLDILQRRLELTSKE